MKVKIIKNGQELTVKDALLLYKGPVLYDPEGKFNGESDSYVLEVLHQLNNTQDGIDYYEVIEPLKVIEAPQYDEQGNMVIY